MVDKKFIGKKYPAQSYHVGREKIREYAKAIGDKNPVFHDEDAAKAAGYDTIIAPPTFAVVYTGDIAWQVLLDKEMKLNLMMLVHGEMDFEFGELVKDGDVITSECEVADIYDKKGKDFVVAKIESRNQNGDLVVRGLSTFVIRG